MGALPKADLKKDLDEYRGRAGEFRLLELGPARYLMADGHGDPNTSPAYTAALGALYPVAYALKALARRELGRDHVVPPLEGLWRASDMELFTRARDKSRWDWTLMIRIPDWVPAPLVQEAIAAKGAGGTVREGVLEEGLCVQTLHIGPYDAEGPVLARMHEEVIPSRGLLMTGDHHEIYLGDPRRTAPERLRTLLRQPVRR